MSCGTFVHTFFLCLFAQTFPVDDGHNVTYDKRGMSGMYSDRKVSNVIL